jgi:hypothetical protein
MENNNMIENTFVSLEQPILQEMQSQEQPQEKSEKTKKPKKEKNTTPECPVCCEKMNKSTLKPIECNFCNYVCCRLCVTRYVLSGLEPPNCLKCKMHWSEEFLFQNLTKKFIESTLKEHKMKLLFEREKGLMPSTQEKAEKYKLKMEYEKEHTKLYKLLLDIQREHTKIRVYDLHDEENYKKWCEYKKQIECIKIDMTFVRFKINNVDNIKTANEKRVFLRGCPSDGCRGFLSTQWKCGICNVKVCSQCHEIKSTHPSPPQMYATTDATIDASVGVSEEKNDNGDDNVDDNGDDNVDDNGDINGCIHVCKPENIETAKLIEKDSKHCPNCSAIIYKIEGCSQMYCTQCHTAFNWNTLRIETGRIHNPHYYEWLRKQNNGNLPHEPGDIPCGGIPEINTILRILPLPKKSVQTDEEYASLYKMRRHISNIHRICTHIEFIVIPRYRVNTTALNEEIRIKYMLNLITEKDFKESLYKNKKSEDKQNEISLVLDMFINTSADIFRRFLDPQKTFSTLRDILPIVNELEALRIYTNHSLIPISKRYSYCSVPTIRETFAF